MDGCCAGIQVDAPAVTSRVPWPLKMAAKLLLSRLPIRHSFWKRLGCFRLGRMEDPDYALAVWNQHSRYANPGGRGFAALELGPGDSLAAAIIAAASGVSRTYFVDNGDFASRDVAVYSRMAQRLRTIGLSAPDIHNCDSFAQVLRACHAEYLTNGLSSLWKLPDHSVDFIWSHAVLEHVRLSEFEGLQRELHRILRPGGVCSHEVDLRDHLNMGLQQLRFPRRFWESALVVGSGFYTNRLRRSEILLLMERAGFQCSVVSTTCWEHPVISRQSVHRDFQMLDDREFSVSGLHVVCK